VNVELDQGRLISDKTTTYPSVLFVGRTGYSDPTILIAFTPYKGSLKDDNTPRLVNAFMRNREYFLGGGVRY
jgi:hypothetical protein